MAHEVGYAFAAGHDPLISEFSTDAGHAVGLIACLVGSANALQQPGVGLCACTGWALMPVVKAACTHVQCFAQRTNGKFGLVCFHEFVDGMNVLSLLVANQAVAFARMSRSVWTCLNLRRSSISSWRSWALRGVALAVCDAAAPLPPAWRTQLRMLVVWQPNSFDNSLGLRPLLTSSTICWRNPGAYGGLVWGISDSLFQLESVREMGSTSTSEIVGGGAGKQHSRTPRNQPLLEFKLGVLQLQNHSETQHSCRFRGFFRGD